MKSAVMEQEKREQRRRTIELEQHELQDVFLRAGEVPPGTMGSTSRENHPYWRPWEAKKFRLVKH